MDFTLKTYHQLLDALIAQGFAFQSFAGFLENPAPRAIILRHDVEARYGNALVFARIQHQQGIRGTYYFRILRNHFDAEIIREIAALGHEIGYHYDDLSFCRGDREKALQRFEKNLATLREIAPVKTICMEGAPLSKWDNRWLWSRQLAVSSRQSAVGSQQSLPGTWNPGTQEPGTRNQEPGTLEFGTRNSESGIRNYRDYGIIGEPYFDIDFTKVLYLTDTGRRWDGVGSIRDKVNSELRIPDSELIQNSKFKIQNFRFHHTADIIATANAGLLPDQIMLTFHPQRWTDKPLPWLKELVLQNVKNVAKSILLRRRA